MKTLMLSVMGLVGFLWFGAAPAADKDQNSLDGTWMLTSGQVNGKPLVKEALKGGRLVIKGDRYTIQLPGKGTVAGVQKLDAAKEPRTIDITDDSGANKGKTCLGIYQVKGNEFRVVFAQPGKARPSEFTTAPESGQWLHVWKRAQ